MGRNSFAKVDCVERKSKSIGRMPNFNPLFKNENPCSVRGWSDKLIATLGAPGKLLKSNPRLHSFLWWLFIINTYRLGYFNKS